MCKEEFKDMLEFTQCNTRDKVFKRAKEIATELVGNWEIVSPAGVRRVLGVEFYLNIPTVFEDNATHRREEQLESGTFYFHTKSTNGWTPPIINRHGVDITCGNKDKGIYGGILLRHLSGEGHRDGSGLALRSLVRGDVGFKPIKRGSPESKWNNDEIDFFYKENNTSIFEGNMYLRYAPLQAQFDVEPVKRVGIKNTNFADELLGFRYSI